MRNGFLGLITTVLAGAGAVLAQPPAPPPPDVPAAEKSAVRPPPPPPAEDGEPAPPAKPVLTSVLDRADLACDPDLCETSRYWFVGEYLLWTVKEAPLSIPLVTTGPTDSGGIIGREGTRVLFGGFGLNFDTLSGGRFTAGRWLNPEHTLGVEASGFFLEQGREGFMQNSNEDGTPLLARPIISARTLDPTSILLSADSQFTGGIRVLSCSRLWGTEGNVLYNLLQDGETGVDLLMGLRYMDLDECLGIASRTAPLPANPPNPGGVAFFEQDPVLSPNAVVIRDAFFTRNQFYGGQVGARARYRYGRLLVDATGKVAFGGVHQSVQALGNTALVTPNGVAAAVRGGALATVTNIGRRAGDDGAIVPEAAIRVGYQITERLSAHVGYTVIYWDNVVRPGDQISRVINLTQVPSSAAFGPLVGRRVPAPQFQEGRFWAQGFTVGLGLRF